MHTFCNLVRQTERVWLFKSDEAAKGVIAAPLGLHARFVTYFPDDWKEWNGKVCVALQNYDQMPFLDILFFFLIVLLLNLL